MLGHLKTLDVGLHGSLIGLWGPLLGLPSSGKRQSQFSCTQCHQDHLSCTCFEGEASSPRPGVAGPSSPMWGRTSSPATVASTSEGQGQISQGQWRVGPAEHGFQTSTGMACMACMAPDGNTDINTEPSSSRTTDPDMALGSSLGPDVTIVLGGRGTLTLEPGALCILCKQKVKPYLFWSGSWQWLDFFLISYFNIKIYLLFIFLCV